MLLGVPAPALAFLAGVVLGVFLVGARASHRSQRPIARLFAVVIEPVVYWADLRGPDGRPSHSKVAYFLTLVVALVGLVVFGVQEVRQGAGLGMGFDLYAALVFALAFGRHAYLGFLQSRFGAQLGDVFARRSGAQTQPSLNEAERADTGYVPPAGGL